MVDRLAADQPPGLRPEDPKLPMTYLLTRMRKEEREYLFMTWVPKREKWELGGKRKMPHTILDAGWSIVRKVTKREIEAVMAEAQADA